MSEIQKIIVMRGLPGCGKSTYAKQYVRDNLNTIRVCRDDIRDMLTPIFPFGSKMEELVTLIEDNAIEEALKNKYSVIVDATNFRNPYKWTNLCLPSGCQYIVKDIDTPLEECIERDSKRSNPCGKEIIERMYNKYINRDKQKHEIR